jgi:hypothetical protein
METKIIEFFSDFFVFHVGCVAILLVFFVCKHLLRLGPP